MHAACIQPFCFDLVILYNKMFVKQISGLELKDRFNHVFTEKEIQHNFKKCGYGPWLCSSVGESIIICQGCRFDPRTTGNMMNWHDIYITLRVCRKNREG